MTLYKAVSNVVMAIACMLIVLPALLIATGALPLSVYIVHTGSMAPTIPSDSAVFVQRGVYRVGQVITFNTPNGVVTHRLIERRSDGALVTKGDANATPDPGVIAPGDVIGGVIASPRFLGFVLAYVRSPLGLASVALALVVLWRGSEGVAEALDRRRQARWLRY